MHRPATGKGLIPMSQIKVRKITYSAVVGSAAFQAGVSDYQTGKVDFDRYSNGKGSWHYERGRLFAAERTAAGLTVPPSRVGRRVSSVACAMLAHAFKTGSVI